MGAGRRSLSVALAACALMLGVRGTQDAVANGDTRTIELVHTHTQERLRVTFRRDGSFDSNALSQLNHFLRDWRNDEQTAMAPQLFDVVWYVYREVGATEPVKVVSAYRSPNTNAMLARRSRGVAKNSHHMRGNAMDFHIPGVSMAKVREIGMRLQRGGVGYYPAAGSAFVHLDVGTVRSWPRMPRDQLERLFPDGKTVHIPADGIPLANYQLALAEVQARGGSALDYDTVISNRGKSLWALLFGSGEEDDGGLERATTRGRNARAAVAAVAAVAQPRAETGDNVMVASVQPGAVTAFAAAPPLPRQTELRPQPGSEPAAATPPQAGTVPPQAGTVPPQAATVPAQAGLVEIAGLPLPPIRPRGLGEIAPIAANGPVPADLPLPPIRSSTPAAIASLPASPPAAQVASLAPPAASLRPAPDLALPPLRSPPVSAPPAAPVNPPVPVRHAVDAAARGDIAVLIAAQSTRLARPMHVVNVAPPPVEREVKRGVVAMGLGKATPAAIGNGRFAGRFIRPMSARFTQAGDDDPR
ncbi:MAG: DUF882 domain-containing protein [Methylobacterium sp.]|nr:DUF882 domain-containing protein [Methylobacterium sp.]MCA3603765.1 DUF882 domain-containing protein [Methylobacterium sp.]MCA3615359.1 DUF882 domain-containing protein [Methylobacterium sp.]